MQNNKEQIYFNFSYLALKLLGKNMYSSAWNALSELVANGLDANAEKIYLFLDMTDKEHSRIEIIDSGFGMNYEDLAHKYAWIGRNKRTDETLSDEEKMLMMGRKGVGKLAAFYLSNHINILTKTREEESAWGVDIRHVKDEDSPYLARINKSKINLCNSYIYEQFKTGTAIVLNDVDLRGIGEQTIGGFKARLADFYLLHEVNAKIFMAVKNRLNEEIQYEKIEKNTSLKNLSAIFTTNSNMLSLISSEGILMPSNINRVANKRRAVKVFEPSSFQIEGEEYFSDENGNKLPFKSKYQLKGWIGIHASIKAKEAKRNDDNYIKNKAYSPNALRLYVRNKLAVANLMNYVKSTQAMSNYIEGEISFDILDDDLLPDISTSNREGYPIEDERVQLLLKLIDPILKSLYAERLKLAKIVSEEENAYNLEQEALKEAARRKAELEAEKALREKQLAEQRAAELSEENKNYQKRIVFFEKGFKGAGEQYKLGMHLGVNFAKEIRSTVLDLFEYSTVVEDYDNFNSTIMSIDRNAEKIEKMPEYIGDVKFSLNSQFIDVDVIDFINQYFLTKNTSRLNCIPSNTEIKLNKKADFGSLIMLVENIISNSRKAMAKNLYFNVYNQGNKTILEFYDDSEDGLNKKYWKNPNIIFELAEKTGYQGFGIGCYQIREIIKELDGTVEALGIKESEQKMKLILRMTFKSEQI